MYKRQVSKLCSLELSYNPISESSLAALYSLENLACLYFRGNRRCGIFRKTLVSHITSLKYIDDKPVTELDILCANAWVTGGAEAEEEVKKKFYQEKAEEQRKLARGYHSKHNDRLRHRRSDSLRKEQADLRAKILKEQIARTLEYVEKLELNGGAFTIPTRQRKKLQSLSMNKMEELLLKHTFDFEALYLVLKSDYECSVDSLREQWTEFENVYRSNYNNC